MSADPRQFGSVHSAAAGRQQPKDSSVCLEDKDLSAQSLLFTDVKPKEMEISSAGLIISQEKDVSHQLSADRPAGTEDLQIGNIGAFV